MKNLLERRNTFVLPTDDEFIYSSHWCSSSITRLAETGLCGVDLCFEFNNVNQPLNSTLRLNRIANRSYIEGHFGKVVISNKIFNDK